MIFCEHLAQRQHIPVVIFVKFSCGFTDALRIFFIPSEIIHVTLGSISLV